jgi:hypothetical protein
MNAQSPNPEENSSLWRFAHKLEKKLDDLTAHVNTPTPWDKLWGERSWLIPFLVSLMFAVLGGLWYVGGLAVDKHIASGIGPLQTKIDGLQGSVSVLQSQVAYSKLSSVPTTEIKSHKNELISIKNDLAKSPRTVPGFWPASFQLINLLSKTTFNVEPSTENEALYDNVIGPIKVYSLPGRRYFLKDRIANLVFKDAIIRFDQSVQLENVTFINCILIFPNEANPSRTLQEIGNRLLTSDVSDVTITTS